MILRQFMLDIPMLETNAFILGDESSGQALLVDCGLYDPRFEAFLTAYDLTLTKVFLTHGHWDHVDGLAEVLKKFDVPVFGYEARIGGYEIATLAHGDEFGIGALKGHVVHTPGHTPDGLSLIFPPGPSDNPHPGIVFAGDALFCGSVGGTSTQSDYDRQIAAIREHLLTLPGDYEIHVGHGPSSTIAAERDFNPFFV